MTSGWTSLIQEIELPSLTIEIISRTISFNWITLWVTVVNGRHLSQNIPLRLPHVYHTSGMFRHRWNTWNGRPHRRSQRSSGIWCCGQWSESVLWTQFCQPFGPIQVLFVWIGRRLCWWSRRWSHPYRWRRSGPSYRTSVSCRHRPRYHHCAFDLGILVWHKLEIKNLFILHSKLTELVPAFCSACARSILMKSRCSSGFMAFYCHHWSFNYALVMCYIEDKHLLSADHAMTSDGASRVLWRCCDVSAFSSRAQR